jgi:hypothetical protein
MPVALLLIFITMAHQSHIPGPAELLQETQRKLLAVVLDEAIVLIDPSNLPKLLSIPTAELAPGNEALMGVFQQGFARRKIWHPNVIVVHRQIPSTKACRKYAQPIALPINWRIDGLRPDHEFLHSRHGWDRKNYWPERIDFFHTIKTG